MDLLVISDPRHPLVAGTAWEEDVRAAAAAAAAEVGSGCGGGASRQPLQLTAGATAGVKAGDADGAVRWQSQGNALFGSGHFVDALHAYHQGLVALQQAGQAQLASEQQAALAKRTAVLLNNSAAACLGFGAHESARAYAQLALRRTLGDATTLLHLAKALDGLGRYSEAADACQDHVNALARQLQSSNSNSSSSGLGLAVTAAFTDGQRFLQSLRQRAAEAERGEYNEAGMAREAAASTTPRLEGHADFIGPVQVADAGEGRGRGLYMTAPVRAGQLLLAMRADVASFAADMDTSTMCCDERAAADVAALGAASAQLKWDLPPAVLGCGRLAARLAHLHTGGRTRVPPVPPAAECGFVPTWRPVAVAAPFRLRLLDCCRPHQRARGLEGGHDSCQRAGGDQVNDGGDGSAGKPTATGLWGLASYFNHACVANAHRYFLGDFLFVRASRDLPAGAEVTITYLNPTLTWEQRSAKLLRRGFACGCELCMDETEWRRGHPDEPVGRG
eukprot:XP_001701009.1 predicted protein [Chlamydomonas reinhardtii]